MRVPARRPRARRSGQPRTRDARRLALRRALRARPRGWHRHVSRCGPKASSLAEGRLPGPLAPLFVPKGSVAVDGISLTVAGAGRRCVRGADHSVHLAHTNLRAAGSGRVNLECDMIGKYVARAVSWRIAPATVQSMTKASRSRAPRHSRSARAARRSRSRVEEAIAAIRDGRLDDRRRRRGSGERGRPHDCGREDHAGASTSW